MTSTDTRPTDQARAAGRRRPRPMAATVLRTERLSTSMVRVVLGGGDLERFPGPSFADAYVKVLFLHPDGEYPTPLDVDVVRETMPAEFWPRMRSYTVRAWDPDAHELTLDFVVHGERGIAGPWAARATAGDVVHLLGPGGAYSPDPAAEHHLLIGDESALPAIAAALELLPDDADADVLIEVAGPTDQLPLPDPAGARIRWVHRGTRPVGERLVETARGLDLADGRTHAFVHGEAGFVRDLRRWLRMERIMPVTDLSVSGYWRLGDDDEAWRAGKRDYNTAIETEEQALAERG